MLIELNGFVKTSGQNFNEAKLPTYLETLVHMKKYKLKIFYINTPTFYTTYLQIMHVWVTQL